MSELFQARFGGGTRIYGSSFLEKAKSFHVCVVGIGGVGSWACEALARSGISEFSIVDIDDICVTNTNRQIHAIADNVGVLKIEAMRERILAINPDAVVHTFPCFFNSNTAALILAKRPDFVIDAIDSVPDKCVLVKECMKIQVPFIISGGAGGKTDSTQIRIADLGKSQGDSLLKSLKRALKREHGVQSDANGNFHIPCVFSPEPPILPWNVCAEWKQENAPGTRLGCASGFGSLCHVTGSFGFALAGFALRNGLMVQAPIQSSPR